MNYTLKGSINLKSFITDLKRELTYKILKEKKKMSKEDDMLNFIKELLSNLNAEDKVSVLIDKTNGCIIITLKNYRILMFKNEENIDEIDVKEVSKFKGEVVKILKRYNIS